MQLQLVARTAADGLPLLGAPFGVAQQSDAGSRRRRQHRRCELAVALGEVAGRCGSDEHELGGAVLLREVTHAVGKALKAAAAVGLASVGKGLVCCALQRCGGAGQVTARLQQLRLRLAPPHQRRKVATKVGRARCARAAGA